MLLVTILCLVDPVWESVDAKLLTPGYEAKLGNPGQKVDTSKAGIVAVSVSAWQELQKYGKAGDEDGLKDMMKRRQVLCPSMGETLKVIEARKDGLVEVRIMTGEYKSKRGYLPAKYLCAKIVPRG